MSWLSDLLKHMSISKSFTGAIFVSSAVLIGGPQIAPQLIDPVPTEWRWLALGACIFSFVLLALWAIPSAFRGVLSTADRIINSPALNPPSEKEWALLALLGTEYPNSVLNIDRIQHNQMSKLELLGVCTSLDKKGLIRVNQYNDNLVNLTENGRKKAFKFLQERA